jgi:hypothetical protein
MTWQLFGPGEVFAKDAYFYLGPGGRTTSITGITTVIPPDGSNNRQINNFVCPSQFARANILTRNAPNDSLYCYGAARR